MVRRLNADWTAIGQRRVCRHRDLNKPIIRATSVLASAMTMLGLRYLIELTEHKWLVGACDDLLFNAEGGDTNRFIFYWFCSIAFTEYFCYSAIMFSIWLRKKHDWDKLLRLPLKLPKSTTGDMTNMLGALKEEIEENRFKHELVDNSELTYKKALIDGFDDNFDYT